jgi:hypothetical protein
MRGKNPAAFDLELLNPYQGIDASQNERHNIRNISGQPPRRGIWVDAIYDIGRIENVHFNPWWNSHNKAYQWQTANGEAFIFGRADWEYVLNTFCFGYHVGYKFVETATGVQRKFSRNRSGPAPDASASTVTARAPAQVVVRTVIVRL